ncbi:uncharacterized protein DNG_06412 [Cephalotrichum gorgonifer]|uniref:AB hydrolase-1 domain-containing protein n=1 Tax=Cephalotrichum gorgonifer TaxID=2041049 RepID=A0AAE8N1L8_9PEZI|nr:uncharacterized protein DNG_06412 [Cephalotrichum gorgonifer]
MKPTFVFVSGAWHRSDYWGPLTRGLADAGYPSVAVTPRCVNSEPAATSFQPDVDAVKETLVNLLEKGTNVIVLAHSYGGVVGTEAVGDVVANNPGFAAQIKRLVYVAAFVPIAGLGCYQLGIGAPGPENPVYYAPDDAGNLVLTDGSDEIFYHDVAEPHRSEYTAILGKEPFAAFGTPPSYLGWEKIPSSYVYTKLDRALLYHIQEFMVKRVQDVAAESGKASVKPFSGPFGLFSLESGHSPMLSKTAEMAGILSQIAEEA